MQPVESLYQPRVIFVDSPHKPRRLRLIRPERSTTGGGVFGGAPCAAAPSGAPGFDARAGAIRRAATGLGVDMTRVNPPPQGGPRLREATCAAPVPPATPCAAQSTDSRMADSQTAVPQGSSISQRLVSSSASRSLQDNLVLVASALAAAEQRLVLHAQNTVTLSAKSPTCNPVHRDQPSEPVVSPPKLPDQSAPISGPTRPRSAAASQRPKSANATDRTPLKPASVDALQMWGARLPAPGPPGVLTTASDFERRASSTPLGRRLTIGPAVSSRPSARLGRVK
jgi:hypothetical protein